MDPDSLIRISEIASHDEIGTLSMRRLINEFKRSIDERIRILEKEMEGI